MDSDTRSTYINSLQNAAKIRYLAKLQLIGVEVCPYQVGDDKWLDDPTRWPNLTYHDLYHYLIKTPRLFSSKAMENYKSLDAYKFFIDGWVQVVNHFTGNDDTVTILKAAVRPSFRTTEAPHNPWVALSNSGSVITGHCNCMAGLGETCSHVAALLYKIEAAVRMGYTSKKTPTELPCQWNQNFTKNIIGSTVAEINLYSNKAKQKVTTSANKKTQCPSNEDFSSFIKTLSEIAPKTVGLSLFVDYQQQFFSNVPDNSQQEIKTLIPPLRTLYDEKNLLLSSDAYKILVEKTMLDLKHRSPNEYVYVEEVTRNQSLSFSWFQQRAGRITGSTVYSVAHGNVDKPARSIVLKLCSDKQRVLNVPAINWGKQNENKALDIYKRLATGADVETISITDPFIHAEFDMQSIGLVISEKTPWLAASPDACVFCHCCGYGVVEVKCPFNLRDISLTEYIECGQFYVIKCEDGTFSLKENHQYFYQVQLEMYCTETAYCDFFVWTPKESICVRIQRNEKFICQMVTSCSFYWKEVILKELLLRNIEHEDEQDNSNDRDLRICKMCKLDEDDMMKCSTCHSWFHPSCVKRKTLAKNNTWNCKSCKKIK